MPGGRGLRRAIDTVPGTHKTIVRDNLLLSPTNAKSYPCKTCGDNVGEENSLECEICGGWTHGAQVCPTRSSRM